jgi:hypothetical protein
MNYNSKSAWLEATTGSTSYFVETFQNNEINTPNLGVTNCSWDCMYPTGLDFISKGTYYAADGKYALQVNGKIGSYVQTIFTMPANIDGIGFQLYAPQSQLYSPLGMVIKTTDGSAYWQWGGANESQSPAFDGFIGFVSSTADIVSVDLVGGAAQISQIIGADPTPAPEPGTFAVIGAGLLGVAFWRRGSRR